MGECPFLEWIEQVAAESAGQMFVSTQAVREMGHELRRPEADYLRDGIYELRVSLRGVNHRILYFFHENVGAVVSHGLMKERAVPPKDVDRAVERMRRFEAD